jgi:hypothetical protein
LCRTGVAVSATGAAGLAGVLATAGERVRSGGGQAPALHDATATEHVVVIFSGGER